LSPKHGETVASVQCLSVSVFEVTTIDCKMFRYIPFAVVEVIWKVIQDHLKYLCLTANKAVSFILVYSNE